MDADGGEVAVLEQPIELVRSRYPGHEDHYLVELEGVEEVVQLAVLLLLVEADEVLLQTVKGQLGVVVNEDLEGLC